MKFSKAQQALLKRVERGEHIRRNETFVTNTWFSTDINADSVNARTVDILMSAGLVEKRTVGTNYHRLVELFVTDPIDYSADSDSGDADRITPDAAGEDWAPEPVTGFMRPCERCNGTGTIDRGGTSPWHVVHCPDCGGTGIYDSVTNDARYEREYWAWVKEEERRLEESLDYEETHPLDRYEPWGYEF